MSERYLRTKIVLPILILLVGVAIAYGLIAIRPDQVTSTLPAAPPALKVVRVFSQPFAPVVHSQGVVMARTEIDLILQVAGRIIRLHPAFVTGEVFGKDDVLVTIDPRDYDHAITQAQADVAQAKHRLAVEEEEAEQARYEWQVLGGDKPPTPLMLRVPQLAEARARLKAAKAALAQARLQRNRCEWRAPFAGRIREKSVGIGQVVQSGEALGRLYAADVFEVRLPLSADQLDAIKWPSQQDGLPPSQRQTDGVLPKVMLSAQLGGSLHRWHGRIARIEGAFNDVTGLLHAVAEVDFVEFNASETLSLLPGLFVQAQIEARVQEWFKLPREAISSNRNIALIDTDGRLRMQPVTLRQVEADRVWIDSGIEAGMLVVTPAPRNIPAGSQPRYEIIEAEALP